MPTDRETVLNYLGQIGIKNPDAGHVDGLREIFGKRLKPQQEINAVQTALGCTRQVARYALGTLREMNSGQVKIPGRNPQFFLADQSSPHSTGHR